MKLHSLRIRSYIPGSGDSAWPGYLQVTSLPAPEGGGRSAHLTVVLVRVVLAVVVAVADPAPVDAVAVRAGELFRAT